jgi:hypothetical protein
VAALCGCATAPPWLRGGSVLGAGLACLALLRLRRRWRLDAYIFAKPYARWTLLAFALVPWAHEGDHTHCETRALMIGLGGGSLCHFWHALLPRCAITAVEINPAVIAAAQDQFGLRQAPGRLCVHCLDGAEFVAQAPAGTYRLILCDLDVGTLYDSAPHFARVLAPDGVVVVNIFVESKGARRLLLLGRALHALLAHFEEVHVVRTGPSNSMLIALPRASAHDREGVAERAGELCRRKRLPFDLRADVATSDSYAIRRRHDLVAADS